MRTQIKQNQFWTALILAFFILAFSFQDAQAQKRKSTPRKRPTTTKSAQPTENQSEPQPQNVSSENETPTQNEAKPPKSPSSDENSASLKETLDWMKAKLGSNKVVIKAFLPSDSALADDSDGDDKWSASAATDVTLAAFTNSPKEFESCAISWGEVVAFNGMWRMDKNENRGFPLNNIFVINGNQVQNYTTTVNLKDLDPLSIKIDEGNFKYTSAKLSGAYIIISFSTTDNKKVITTTYNECFETAKGVTKSIQCSPTRLSEKGSIPFSGKEVAERFAKAMKHSIKLCGGKVEPF